MYEDYLEDSHHFASEAEKITSEREARRFYRASVLFSVSALEAFLNFVGNTFHVSGVYDSYEVAFLTDKKFGIKKGKFVVLEQTEYHRLEEKIRYLFEKYDASFDFSKEPSWSRFLEFKKLRDAITHPRELDDEIPISEYKKKVREGLNSIIVLIDKLCRGIFKKPLRRGVFELQIQ